MGMVFQQFNLFNNKTVIENIMMAPLYIKKQELRSLKLKNFFIKITNIFTKNKKNLYEIDKPSQIVEEVRKMPCAFLKG